MKTKQLLLLLCSFFLILGTQSNLQAQPVNDLCANAIDASPILGDSLGVDCTTVLVGDAPIVSIPATATISNEGGGVGCSTQGADVWYTWVATQTGMYWQYQSAGGDPGIRIYSGECGSLNLISCLNTFSSGILSGWNIGDTVYIQIHDFGNASGLTLDFCLQSANTGCTDSTALNYNATATVDDGSCYFLTNHECAGAIPYPAMIDTVGTCPANTFAMDNTLSTNTSDVNPSCDASFNFGQWFTFTSPGTGISFSNGAGDPGIAIYDGSCGGGLIEVGCVSTFASGTDLLVGGLTPGEEYYAYIWDNTAGLGIVESCLEYGNIGCTDSTAINFDPTAGIDDGNCYFEINDVCTGAIAHDTIGGLGSCTGFTLDITNYTENGLLPTCDGFGDAAAWFYYTATGNSLSFDDGDGFGLNCALGIEVLDTAGGSCAAGFTSMGCLNNFSGNIFGLTPGTTYWLVIWDDGLTGTECEYCLEQGDAGCTNPVASNFDPLADVDDGSCIVLDQGCYTTTQVLSGCSGAYVGDTIYPGPDNGIATAGLQAKWYIFEAPGTGVLNLNFTTPIIAFEDRNPESYVHDLGPGPYTGDSSFCDLAVNGTDNDALGEPYSYNTNVIGGNVYAIELGNSWTDFAFDWDWTYGCEAIVGNSVVGTTDALAQLTWTDTISSGDTILADIVYNEVGSNITDTLFDQTPGALISGLNAGTDYEYCLSYSCPDGSGCNSISTCGTFQTQVTCTTPDLVIETICVATNVFSFTVEVTDDYAFQTTIFNPGNPSGFNILIDQGTGYFDTGFDVTAPDAPVLVNIPLASGSPINVRLIGIDIQGCPQTFLGLDADCFCFGGIIDDEGNCIYTPAQLDTVLANSPVDTIGCNETITFSQSTIAGSTQPALTTPSSNNAIWFQFLIEDDGELTVNSCIDPTSNDTDLSIVNLSQASTLFDDDGCSGTFGSTIPGGFAIPGPVNVNAGDTVIVEWGDQWSAGPFDWEISIYCEVLGCTDSTAIGYDPEANVDDGSCDYLGCTDTAAFNYDPMATIDDGSCVPVVMGCTDSLAANYNPMANVDDGSCIFCQQVLVVTGAIPAGVQTYQADDIITSSATVSGDSTLVTFLAGNPTPTANTDALGEYIELQSGFDADGTRPLSIEIGDCDDSDD